MSKKGGIDALYSTLGSTIGALCEREKGTNPPRYGKKEAKASQVRLSRREMDNMEFSGRLIGNVDFQGATTIYPRKH